MKWVVKFVKNMELTYSLSSFFLLFTGEKGRQNLLKKNLDLTSDLLRVNEDKASYIESKFSFRSERIWIWNKHFLRFEFECKNSVITSHLFSLSSNSLIWEILRKFDEATTLGPICPNLYICIFFYLRFLSRAFTNHRTAGEGGGHSFNSSLPLPLASQTLRH